MGKRQGAAFAAIGLMLWAIALTTGCGGGSTTNGLQAGLPGSEERWPVHGYQDAARSGSFAVVAVDSTERQLDPLTRELRLEVSMDGSGQLLRIIGQRLERRSELFLHLSYDADRLHPALTRPGRWMPETAIFLGITRQPGLVAIGISETSGSLPHGEEVELAAVRFESGGWSDSRGVSAVATTPVSDLHFDPANPARLVWTFTNPGDYNQDSEVGVADITPIGINLRRTNLSPSWTAAQVADGDKNGEVNTADLVPIAANYRNTVTGYQVKGAASPAGPFAADALVSFSTVAFPLPPGGGYRQLSHTLGTPVEGSWYSVTAMSGAQEAAQASNIVQYSSAGTLPAPQNLTAAQAGLGVRLNWQAPAGATPDSYNCYFALGSNMTGATMLNLPGQVVGLSFDCPLVIQPTGSYYFAVKAVYSGSESPYSNIYGYNTDSGSPAPTGLTASKVGNQVRLEWLAAPGATAYNCYVGTDGTMSGALLMNLPPTPLLQFDCPLSISPDSDHYFAVKALHDGSGESGYSNVYHYSAGGGGGDTTPPVWQGGEGIKAATPSSGGGSVLVSWYIATDAQSPPVQYLFYVVPDGQAFDWDDPAEIFASSILSTPVTTLPDGTPLQNGQRYKFAVRAQDSASPSVNRTANENFLYGTPQILPPNNGHIPNSTAPIQTSDNASVRVQGEEVPRMAGVNRGNNLYYVKWDLTLDPPAWTVYDLNNINAACPAGRKYHPQLVAIGDTVHLLFATGTDVYEFFGDKDSPASWELKTIGGGYSATPGITGSALVHSESGNYLACVYSARSGTEQLWYSDRDMSGEWSAPVSIMSGSPQIWQCDMTIDENSGAQWAVASNGSADSSGNLLKFWYVRRDNRTAAWGTAVNSTKGSDVMTIDMDYSVTPAVPVVVSAQVREVPVGAFGNQPVSDAAVLTWTGNAWAEQVLEQGDCIFDNQQFTLDTILTGQDPQLIFSPSGKAVALWSNLDFFVNILDSEGQLTGDWRFSQRPATVWSNPASLLAHISSSNSVTAGESFQHCLTSDLGQIDAGDYTMIANKYSERNNYVAGPMYFLYKAWN